MRVELGPADLKDGEHRSYEVGDQYVLVTRVGGSLHAINDQCNHAGCLLSAGWLDNGAIVCPCHEYKFDVITGLNVTLPKLCDDQPAYPLNVENGIIVVHLPEAR